MLHTHLAQITTLITALVVAWALTSGGWPERAAALALALDWTGSILLQDRQPHHHGQPATFALDVCQFVLFLVLVVKCRRGWVLWAAAFALLLILTYLSMMLDTRFGQWTYLTANYIWSMGMVLALAVGMAVEGRRRLVRFQ